MDFYGYSPGSIIDNMFQEWNKSVGAWEEFKEEAPTVAKVLEGSETVFTYTGAILEESLSSVPDSAIGLISNPVARAWTSPNTYFGIKLAEGTGGTSFRTGPGGVVVFEGISPDSNTGKFLSLIQGNPVTFGDVILSRNPTVHPDVLVHEYGHVYQYSVLGPYYPSLYGIDSLRAKGVWKNKWMETRFIPSWARIQ